jgi:hypothetical protein
MFLTYLLARVPEMSLLDNKSREIVFGAFQHFRTKRSRSNKPLHAYRFGKYTSLVLIVEIVGSTCAWMIWGGWCKIFAIYVYALIVVAIAAHVIYGFLMFRGLRRFVHTEDGRSILAAVKTSEAFESRKNDVA